VGAAPQCDVLVHACRMGDQPLSSAPRHCFLAGPDPRRPRWLAPLARIRSALGLIALNGTSLLSFLPAAGLWAWYPPRKTSKNDPSLVWYWRPQFSRVHYTVDYPQLSNVRKFIFIRDNFGAELRLGNGNGADGTLMLYLDRRTIPMPCINSRRWAN